MEKPQTKAFQYGIDGKNYSKKIGNLHELDQVLEMAFTENENSWPVHFRQTIHSLRELPQMIAVGKTWTEKQFMFIRPGDPLPLKFVDKVKTLPEGAKKRMQTIGDEVEFTESIFMYDHGSIYPVDIDQVKDQEFGIFIG